MKPGAYLMFCLSLLIQAMAAGPPDLIFDQLTTREGKTYSKVTVKKINGDSLSIIHESGATTIRFEDLKEDDAKKAGLTPESVKKSREVMAAKEVEKRAAELKSALIKVTIDHQFLRIQGKVLQVLDGGVLLSNAETWEGLYTWFDDPISGSRNYLATLKPIGTCYVACDSKRYVDGQSFTAIVGTNGTQSYTSVIGAKNTVSAYTADLSAAIKSKLPGHESDADQIIKRINSTYALEKMVREIPVP